MKKNPKAKKEIVATAWFREPRWKLVVKQEYSEAFDEVNYANYATLIFLHLAALTILLVSILTRGTWSGSSKIGMRKRTSWAVSSWRPARWLPSVSFRPGLPTRSTIPWPSS